jgi:hypothetical protein
MKTLSMRQERFCELVAEGKTYGEAYGQAYGTGPEVSRKLGSRLMTNGDIQRRVQELRHSIVEESLLSLEDKRRRLAAIVNTDLMALFTDDGELDLAAVQKLPPYVLKDVSVTEKRHRNGGMTRVIRIKIADKLRAIEMDNELAGHGMGGFAGVNEAAYDDHQEARASAARQGGEMNGCPAGQRRF